MTGISFLHPLPVQLVRPIVKCAASGARALGMLIICAVISVTATLLFARLLPVVIGFVGPLRMLCTSLAVIVGLAEFRHLTQPPDEEASQHAKLRPVRN